MMLPIDSALPDLCAALRAAPNAVLIAPPGAGKTTRVGPALLDEPWCSGRIILLSPRRLAARAAAERIAEERGEPVGQSIGYATRMDSKSSAQTRLMIVTEGIFVRQIQDDPELAGVSAVLFDEVHERNLDGDFGLALALEAQAALRPDLRLLAMSATLDGSRFAELLNGPVITSEGRAWPLSLHHIGRRPEARIEDEMARAIRRALGEQQGDLLAFLPGVGEIERTAERLEPLIGIALHRLHGSLEPAEQRAALRPSAQRKVILATAIAETSLTIDGVRIIVDSGLARRARYDPAAGVTRLVTERASQAAVTQRAGRAARQAPGHAYRLWETAATAGLPRFDPPEILEADLAPLRLDCAIWGAPDPRTLAWLDPPPDAALAEAGKQLTELGALDEAMRATTHGRALARIPLAPRLAHMLLACAARGQSRLGGEAAVLLSERGLGGQEIDLDARLTRWRGERSPRAEAARALAKRLARLAPDQAPASDNGLEAAIAIAYPDRLAKRRDASGEHWLTTGGRGLKLDPASPLARHDWLAVAEMQGAAQNARITAAAAISEASVMHLFADRIISGTSLRFDPESGGVRAESGRRLGAIMLARGQDSRADPEAIAAALVAGVREHGLGMLRWSEAAKTLRERADFAGVIGLDDANLVARLDEWLAPLVAGKRRLGEIEPGALYQALKSQLSWDAQQQIERLAPPLFTTPAGTTHTIDYAAEAGPTVEARVQAFFGIAEHPCVGAQRVPLVLSLTSPAGRPIQTTRDLPGFWRGSWAEVAREMRGRYPRHNWPDEPSAALASLKTKKALDRGR